MSTYKSSLETTEDRRVEWDYIGKFIKYGRLFYKCPKTGNTCIYECLQRNTKNQEIDGSFSLPLIKGSEYKEPHLLVIRCYRPAINNFELSFPAGLVDEGELPENTAIRETKEETGYTATIIDEQFPIPYYCDPWKSNEQQRMTITEIDMDRIENEQPETSLEETERITSIITPISTLNSFIKEQSEDNVITTPLYIISSVLSKDSLFNKLDELVDKYLYICLFAMLSLVPYGESSSSSDSEVEEMEKKVIPRIQQEDNKKVNNENTAKESKLKIPSFLDTFNKVEDPEFLKHQRTEKKSVVKFFDLNKPIIKKAMSAEESKEDQERREAERKQKEEQERKEQEAKNEEERRERVRQERQLIDELHQLRREGREKWNQQQKRIRKIEKANDEYAKRKRAEKS